jgi:hypothetical protein
VKSSLSKLCLFRREPLQLWCDDKSIINITNNPVQHDRTKYVEIDQFFIKGQLNSGALNLNFVKFEKQLTDCLTKDLSSREYEHKDNRYLSSILRGSVELFISIY